MKKSLKKAKGKAGKKENLTKLNDEDVKEVSGGNLGDKLSRPCDPSRKKSDDNVILLSCLVKKI